MSLVSDLVVSINDKIAKIGQLLADIVNVNVIKAERDEAVTALQSVDSQLTSLLPAEQVIS